MTPGQARIALLGFLLVATGVVANAHFRQTRATGAAIAENEGAPAPSRTQRARKASEAVPADVAAPRWSTTATGEAALRIARFSADAAKLDRAPDVAQDPVSAKTIAAIQRELTARGYGPLAGEGTLDLTTRAAIMAFEHDRGLPLTGEPSEGLLKVILLGGSASIDPMAPSRGRSAQAEQMIRTVQQRLAALGYRVGHIDGRMGEDTVKAIRDFEMDSGLVPNGRISAEVVTRLGAAPALKPAAR